MKTFLLLAIILSNTAFSKTLMTYNVGLAHTFVPLAKERLPHLISALRKEQADVVCIQEAWKKKDRKKMVQKLKDIYPYSFMSEIKQTRSKNSPTCKRTDLFGDGKFVSCTRLECKGLEGDEFTDCVLNKCQDSLKKLRTENRECATGLMAQVGKGTFGTLVAVFNPFYGAGLFTYKGSNGLILLSKKEISNKKILDMSDISTLTRRQALVANIDNQKIVCTHLSADLTKDVPYSGVFKDWKEENMVQVDRLVREFEDTKESTVLMGDFNCGFENLAYGLHGSFENACKKIIGSGYSNYFKNYKPTCTYCVNNTLSDGSLKMMIDHMFVKGSEITSGEKVFTEKVQIKGRQHNLSDHFGLKGHLKD